MIGFAEITVNFADGQSNVNSPPETIMTKGFVPETAYARGQGLPAQWLNWLFKSLYRAANRDVVSDKSGSNLFSIPNCAIRLDAIAKDDPEKFLTAIGWTDNDGAHHLKVTASAGLTLGTPLAKTDQPILGSNNIISVGYSRQIGGI
jgi:hypothetical protein